MTRLFLAAGVAALAIATPLAAKPGGGHGGGGDHGNGNGGGGAVVQGGVDHGNGGGHGGGGGGEAAFARGHDVADVRGGDDVMRRGRRANHDVDFRHLAQSFFNTPEIDLAFTRDYWPIADAKALEYLLDGLRKAGLSARA